MALVRITALKDFRSGAGLSTTDVTTAYQLGPLTAGQKLYAGLHLKSASLGTTARMLVLSIQASSSSGFSVVTTPTQFQLSTGQGAEWGVPATPSTDLPWFRASWALSTAVSTGGAWNGLVWMGIK